MPLEVVRQNLANTLKDLLNAQEGWFYNRVPAQERLIDELASQLTRLTDDWYEELKRFERDESFARAFQDNRMTMRLLNAAPDRSANDYQRLVQGHEVIKQPDGSFKKTGGKPQVYLSGGLRGLQDRMNPANFARSEPVPWAPPPQSKKNELGLHDLSGRLLDSRFPIGKQGFNLEKTNYAIFVPVPPQEDHELFYNLNLSARGELRQVSEFVKAVSFVRARLTRIKLAEPNDMGSSIVVMADPAGRTRIRYGYTGVVTKETKATVTSKSLAEQLQERSAKLKKVTPENKDEQREDVPLTAEQIRTRIRTAWRYKCVLRTLEQLGNNEIIIAYRQYNNGVFPLITDWPDRGQNPGKYRIQSGPLAGQYLHDNGEIKTS